MAGFGEQFIYPDTSWKRVYYTSGDAIMGSPEDENSDDYKGKTVLFSFVELDNGWGWLDSLHTLYTDLKAEPYGADVAVAVMIFKYGGTVDADALRSGNYTYFSNMIGSTDTFYIIADKDWDNSLAKSHIYEYGGSLTTGPNVYWNYIISSNNVLNGETENAILDIWHHGTGTLTLFGDKLDSEKVKPYQSNDINEVKKYIKKRFLNLTDPPRLVNPNPPNNTWINSLTSMNMNFTRPVRRDNVIDTANWTFGGHADDGLDFASPNIVYYKTGNPASQVTVHLNDGTTDGGDDEYLTIQASGIKDTRDDSGTDPAVAISATTATYKVDKTKPLITEFISPDGYYVNSLSLRYKITANDPDTGTNTDHSSGITGLCIKQDGSSPDAHNESLWISYNGGESEGYAPLRDIEDGIEQSVYSWVKDNAGNVSDRSEIKIQLDREKPKILSFETVLVTNSRTVYVDISATDAGSEIDGWAVTEVSVPPPINSSEWQEIDYTNSPISTNPINPTTYPVDPDPIQLIKSPGDGTKTLFAWVRDRGGNINDLNNFIGEIQVLTFGNCILDTTRPVITSVERQGYTNTNNPNVRFTIAAYDPGTVSTGIAQVKYSNDSNEAATAEWNDWNGSAHEFSHTVQPGVGTKTFYLWVKDGAGNISNTPVSSGDPDTPPNGFKADVTLRYARTAYFVLDYSGSMRNEVSWGGGSARKIDILETGTRAVVALMMNWEAAGENDRIGIIKFHDTIFPADFDGEETGRLLSAPPREPNTSLLNDVNGILDSDCEQEYCTGMGAGLAEAMNRLAHTEPNDNHGKRAVFLISDGFQNRTPFVHTILNDSVTPPEAEAAIDNQNPDNLWVTGDTGYTDIPVHFNTADSNGHVSYPLVHTLGIGTGGGWQETLRQISIAGKNGKWISNPAALAGVNDFFDGVLENLYQGNSPQLVRSVCREFDISDDQDDHIHTVLLNGSASSLAIKLVWAGTAELTFELWKDERKIDTYERKTTGFHYEVGVVEFPHTEPSNKVRRTGIIRGSSSMKHEKTEAKGEIFAGPIYDHDLSVGNLLAAIHEEIEAEGEWTVKVRHAGRCIGKETPQYHLSIFAEEPSITYELDNFPTSVYAGNPLAINLKIFENSEPLISQYAVDCYISKPQIHFGTALSDFEIQKFDTQYQKALKKQKISKAEFKAELLLRDDTLKKKVQQQDIEKIGLKSAWKYGSKKRSAKMKPVFTGTTKATDVPGIYQVEINVRGSSRNGGSIQRMIKRSVHVKFKADAKATVASAKMEQKAGQTLFTFIPLDTNKNKLGPGWEHEIGVFVRNERLAAEDNADGSYGINLTGMISPADRVALLKISILGELIYSDSIERFMPGEKPQKR